MTSRRHQLQRTKVVYRGRVIRVEADTITLPNGRTATMDVVRHRGSVVLVPQPTPADVILIRQFRYVLGRWIWELPAGSLEDGESPAKGARRECAEEVGWHPRTLVRLGAYYPTPGFCDEKLTFYACRDLERPDGPVAHDPDEQIDATTFTLKDAWQLVERGEVIDLKTVVGLGMVSGRIPTRERQSRPSRARRGRSTRG